MKSCVACCNDYQAEIVRGCLVTPRCSATYCLNCMTLMALRNLRCACGETWTTQDSPLFIVTKTEDEIATLTPTALQRRCTCSSWSHAVVNLLFWARTLLAFAMGSCLLPFVAFVTFWVPYQPAFVFLFLVAVLVWPVVRYCHAVFRDNPKAMVWALVLLIFAK